VREAAERQAQEHGHEQIVADHGGQGDGCHDHHAGGRGHAADEDQKGQGFLTHRHGQGQDERVGVHPPPPPGEVQAAAEGNREHEQVDGEQVERKEPDRLGQMVLVDVFDHHDLELARQKQHRKHRQHDVHRPAEVVW
jgi:hypothetical protein